MFENFLFLLTGVIGLITIVLMVASYKSNQLLNIFLLIIFVITSIRFLIHGSFKLGLQTYLTPDSGAISILYLTVVPCFYLYYKSLISGQKSFVIKDLKHFLFIALFYFSIIIPSIRNSFLYHYGLLTNVVFITLFINLYLFLTYRLLKKKLWSKSDIPIGLTHFSLVKKWTIYLFILNTLGVLNFLISIFKEITDGAAINGKSMATLLLLFWLFIFFKILISPEILYGLPVLNKKLLLFSKSNDVQELNKKLLLFSKSNDVQVIGDWELSTPNLKGNQDVRLQEKINANIHSYMEVIDKLSHTDRIFRDSKISSADIAYKMGVPASHIVYLFKYHSQISFSEYRMSGRIKDALNLINDGYLKINTMESLAHKTGFSSYNPFFSAFKKITGLSPQEYIKKNPMGV
ncbi:MAG: AraC family transcriptional regulator [Cellulophaga sp.]